MTRYRVVFSRTAAAHAQAAAEWWLANRATAPALFLDELDTTVRLLETSPRIGALYEKGGVPGVRRLLIGRSRYHVYWEIDAGTRTVTITAVWHSRRGAGPALR